MSHISQAWQGRWRFAWPAGLLFAGVLSSLPVPTAAHDVLTNYVQHSVHLIVGAKHLDLTLDLVFFEEWSARERQAMDADANGRITRPELDSYLKKLAPKLSQQVSLHVAGRELPLVPLYDPEVDLLGSDQTGPAHHRLRLFFFVSTPRMRADDAIVVEDRLWAQAGALVTLQAEGRDGCVLEPQKPGDPGFVSAHPGEARLCKFRCRKPPHTKFGASQASRWSGSQIPIETKPPSEKCRIRTSSSVWYE